MWERVLGGYVGMGLGGAYMVRGIKDESGVRNSSARPRPLGTPKTGPEMMICGVVHLPLRWRDS